MEGNKAAAPVAITFKGNLISKKNRKAPMKNGRGLFLEPKTRLGIERWEAQVPGWARDLRLEHPEVEWFITYDNAHIDVDGVISTVLDILQKYHVIVNDNVAHFGGKQTIWPPERGEYPELTVVLIPRLKDTEVTPPRYAAKRPPKRPIQRPETPVEEFLDFEEAT